LARRGERRAIRLLLLAALLVWLAVTLPLALGWKTLYLRDVATTHLHFKAFGAAELEAGRIPAIRPDWGLGQPFRGNPNALAFYPGNLLYRVLPFWSAFNLHYMLHWLLAFLSFRMLARELGLSPAATVLSALTYAGCGWTISCLTFYNLLTVTAWWPWVVVGALRGGARGVALGGLSCGMALLGGEPVTAALALLPLVWLAVERHGWRRGLVSSFAVGAVGLWVALPQVVATWRVLGFSWRGLHGTTVAGGAYSLNPLRLLELLVPLPFGRPDVLGPASLEGSAIFERVPYVLTVYVGVTALALALMGSLARRRWAVPAMLGLALAALGPYAPRLVHWISGGLFRYPEKFLLWPALFVPLLAGAGLDAVRNPRRSGWRAALPAMILAALAAVLWLAVSLRGPALAAWLSADLTPAALAAKSAALVSQWQSALPVSLALLALTAAAVYRRSAAGLVLVQLVALLPLLGLVRTDDTSFYRRPAPFAERLAAGTTVFTSIWDLPLSPPGERLVYQLGQPLDGGTPDVLLRLRHLDLDFPTGPLAGLSYPLAPDLEGLHGPLHHRFLRAYSRMDPTTFGSWLRALGVEAVTASGEPPATGLQPLATELHLGVPVTLYRVQGTAPRIWCPQEVDVVPSPAETFPRVGAEPDPVHTVRVPFPVDPRPCHRVQLVEETPDRLVFEVEGPGGLVVLRRAYQPLYRAFSRDLDRDLGRDSDRELALFPANLLLLGVEVPPGRQRVVVQVSSWPETTAGGLSLLGILVALGVLWRGRDRKTPTGPTRHEEPDGRGTLPP